MTPYNSLNVKLSNSQFNKFTSAVKNQTGVVLKLSLNIVGYKETNFPHKLLLINRQVKNRSNLLQTNNQLILSYQKVNNLRRYNQE